MIIADGQVTRSVDQPLGTWSPQVCSEGLGTKFVVHAGTLLC